MTSELTLRDVLSELDSAYAYLQSLVGEEDLPGRAENRSRLEGSFGAFRHIAQNVVDLEAEYANDVDHHTRLERSMGVQLTRDQTRHLTSSDAAVSTEADKARIAELERQLAEAKAAANG